MGRKCFHLRRHNIPSGKGLADAGQQSSKTEKKKKICFTVGSILLVNLNFFYFLFFFKSCANKTAKMTIKIQSQQDVPLYKQDLYNNELHNSKIFKDARLKIFDGFPNWFRYNKKPSIDIFFFRSILDGSKTLE